MPSLNFRVNCIAIIGKSNNPLYINNLNLSQQDLRYHYIAHTSLDAVEERINANTKHTDQYLGLLYSIEDLAVYGYITNTKIKFIIIISLADTVIKDQDMKNLFRKVLNAYVRVVSNPFYEPESKNPIKSAALEELVREIAAMQPPVA